MAFTSSDLASLETAIKTLAFREATEVEIEGRRVRYERKDLRYLNELRQIMLQDIAASGDDGGLHLVKPVGRN